MGETVQHFTLNKNTVCLFASSYISKAWPFVFLTQTNHNSLSILFFKGEIARLVIAKVPWVGTSVPAVRAWVAVRSQCCLPLLLPAVFFETDSLTKPVAQLSLD